MPELLLHFSVVFSISAPIMGIKRALILGLVALLPDVDALFYVHRSITHSILFLSIIAAAVMLPSYFLHRGFKLAVASWLSLISHPIMDAFQSLTPLLYPLSQYSYHISPQLFVVISQKISLNPSISVRSTVTDFSHFKSLDAPVFTDLGFIISLLLISVPILHAAYSQLSERVMRDASTRTLEN